MNEYINDTLLIIKLEWHDIFSYLTILQLINISKMNFFSYEKDINKLFNYCKGLNCYRHHHNAQ